MILVLSICLAIWVGTMSALGLLTASTFIVPVLTMVTWSVVGVQYKRVLLTSNIVAVCAQFVIYTTTKMMYGQDVLEALVFYIDITVIVIWFALVTRNCIWYATSLANLEKDTIAGVIKHVRKCSAVLDIVEFFAVIASIILVILAEKKETILIALLIMCAVKFLNRYEINRFKKDAYKFVRETDIDFIDVEEL